MEPYKALTLIMHGLPGWLSGTISCCSLLSDFARDSPALSIARTRKKTIFMVFISYNLRLFFYVNISIHSFELEKLAATADLHLFGDVQLVHNAIPNPFLVLYDLRR